MRRTSLIVLAVIAIPFTALAQSQPPAPGLLPEQIVEARKSAMFLSGGDLAAMKFAADAGADVRQLVPSSRALARWARALPSLFPEGSNVAPTKARPEVWSDRAGFEAAAADYAQAAAALAEAAQAGDRAVFLERWAEVRGSCGACHDSFKAD
jgi:cytochrome c556